jgi:hypothetical protein
MTPVGPGTPRSWPGFTGEEQDGVNLDSKTSLHRRTWFIALIVVMVYVLVSVATAINTADKCGDESAPKHWSLSPPDHWQVIPPEWKCESRF